MINNANLAFALVPRRAICARWFYISLLANAFSGVFHNIAFSVTYARVTVARINHTKRAFVHESGGTI